MSLGTHEGMPMWSFQIWSMWKIPPLSKWLHPPVLERSARVSPPLGKESPTNSRNICVDSNRSSNPPSNKNPKVLLKINRGHADMASSMGAPRCVTAPFSPHSVQDLYTPHSNYIISPWYPT
jgi:hypothetical protein